jgi:hypothetical protein
VGTGGKCEEKMFFVLILFLPKVFLLGERGFGIWRDGDVDVHPP